MWEGLRHPNTVRCLDCFLRRQRPLFRHRGCYWVAPHRARSAVGSIPEPVVSEVLRQLVDRLALLRARDVIRRDVAAANVLVSRGVIVYVALTCWPAAPQTIRLGRPSTWWTRFSNSPRT